MKKVMSFLIVIGLCGLMSIIMVKPTYAEGEAKKLEGCGTNEGPFDRDAKDTTEARAMLDRWDRIGEKERNAYWEDETQRERIRKAQRMVGAAQGQKK